MRYVIVDRLYNLRSDHVCIDVEFEVQDWIFGSNYVGVIFAADPVEYENGTYYYFAYSGYPLGRGVLRFGYYSGGQHLYSDYRELRLPFAEMDVEQYRFLVENDRFGCHIYINGRKIDWGKVSTFPSLAEAT